MSWLADLVLLIHAAFVAFVVGGLALIWIGALCGWQIARNLPFRILHMAAILFVCVEALIGVACPLTVLEDQLRGRVAESGFIARWLNRVIYYDFPTWVFLTIYVLFTLAVAASFFLVPPRRGREKK